MGCSSARARVATVRSPIAMRANLLGSLRLVSGIGLEGYLDWCIGGVFGDGRGRGCGCGCWREIVGERDDPIVELLARALVVVALDAFESGALVGKTYETRPRFRFRGTPIAASMRVGGALEGSSRRRLDDRSRREERPGD